jgi:hypothetical protein
MARKLCGVWFAMGLEGWQPEESKSGTRTRRSLISVSEPHCPAEKWVQT